MVVECQFQNTDSQAVGCQILSVQWEPTEASWQQGVGAWALAWFLILPTLRTAALAELLVLGIPGLYTFLKIPDASCVYWAFSVLGDD